MPSLLTVIIIVLSRIGVRFCQMFFSAFIDINVIFLL